MTPVVIQYPLDLTGHSPDNLVTGERHGPCAAGNRVFVLDYGPFYSKGLVLRNANTNAVLTPNVDYKAVQTFIEPTLQTGKLVCSIIQIQPPAFGFEIECEYQVLGGDYSLSTSALENLIEQLEGDDRPVHWGQIIGKPNAFTPSPHLHDINDVFGWEYVVAALESVRQAILVGDPETTDDFYAYVDEKFGEAMSALGELEDSLTAHLQDYNNPHQVTADQIGLGNVGNYGLATPEIARLNQSNDTLITPYLAPFSIEFHTTDHANPHQVTKAQTGLGNVDNYPTATLEQAIAGVDDASFLTPYRARVAFDAWGGTAPEEPSVPPTANFSYTGDRTVPTGTDPVLTFTDTSTAGSSPIDTWHWDFGNGTTADVQNPSAVTYTFAETSKTFTIMLTVTDTSGAARSKSQSLQMTHTVSQEAPTGMVVTVNDEEGGYTSEKVVSSGVNNASHTMVYACTAPDPATASSYKYQWNVGVASRPGRTISNSSFNSNLQNPGSKSVIIPTNDANDSSYFTQTGTCTVTDQDNGLSTAVNLINQYKTYVQPLPVAAISLNTGASNLYSANSRLTAVFNNNSTLGNTVGESWQSSTWSFSTTSGTVNPASAYNGGDPSPATVQIVNPVIGTGKVTATVLVTTMPSGLTDTTSLQVNFTRLQPAPIGPTAIFTGAISYNAGTDNTTIAVTNSSTNGDVAIVSWNWTVTWADNTVATSSVKNPPAFVRSNYNAGLNRSATISLKVTDSNGLNDTVSHSFALPFQDITRRYDAGSGVETAPAGATRVIITAAGAGSSGKGLTRYQTGTADGGGAGGMAISEYPITGGQTLNYAVGGITGGGILNHRPGNASTVTSGTKTITAMNGGGAPGNLGGTATGGNVSNLAGEAGQPGSDDVGSGGDPGWGPGGAGGRGADNIAGSPGNVPGQPGEPGWVIFFYPGGIYHAYTDPGTYTETAPAGATAVTIAVWGAGGPAADGGGNGESSEGGGAGAYSESTYPITGGQTLNYTVGAGATGTGISSVSSGTKSITKMTANPGVPIYGGAATGGTVKNITGQNGGFPDDETGAPGASGPAYKTTVGGIYQGYGAGGLGWGYLDGYHGAQRPGKKGGDGAVIFYYQIG